jgi:hypothetical protein
MFHSVILTIQTTDIQLEAFMRDASGKVGYYKPIIYPNEFWYLKGSVPAS